MGRRLNSRWCSILAGLLLLCGTCTLSAQDKALLFLYVTKDYTTKVNPLLAELQDIYEFVRNDANTAAIFYLADWTNPVIVRVNLPGDNRQDIDLLYEGLIVSSETSVNPTSDLEHITALLEEYPLRNDLGQPLFTNVEFSFYVCPTFWELFYNEQVISSLWFIHEFDQPWAKGYVSMSVFHQRGDGLTPDVHAPFGPKDLCVNYTFQLLTY